VEKPGTSEYNFKTTIFINTLYSLYTRGGSMSKSNNTEDIELELDYKSKDVEKFFKDRQDDRVKLLKESIADINNMLKTREDLHNQMLKNIDEIDIFINNSMPKPANVTSDAIAANKDIVKELLKKKIELEEIKLEENLNFWRDKAALKKELREHMKEFRDMQSKTSMLDNIVNI
jgi:hypothetical protein